MTTQTSQLLVQVGMVGGADAKIGLENIAVAGAKAEAGANAAKTAMANLSAATEGLTKSATNNLIKARQQIDTFGQGKEFSLTYAATIKGLSEANIALMGAMGAQLDMQKASTAADKRAEEQVLSLIKAKEAQAASEIEQSGRLRKVAEDAIARQALQRAEQDAQSTSPNVWRYGSGAKSSSMSAVAMQQTPSIARDANVAEKAIADGKALEVLAEDYQKVLKVVDPFGEKMINISNMMSTATAARKAQITTEEEYQGVMSKLKDGEAAIQTAKLASELKATEKAALAAGAGLGKFSLESSIAKREGITIVRELLRGDFTRLAGSLSIFANATGLMGTAMAVALNPLTWVVAGITALGIAAVIGEKETSDFNKALIVTGNYAGVTADKMETLAGDIGHIAGGQHAAAEALIAVANSGKFAGEAIGIVGKAAVEMNVMTGQAVAKTVEEFDKLAKDPVKSVLELNDKYHFLTLSVYSQIKALDDQGDHQAASTMATKAFADMIDQRTPLIVENLGTIEKRWKGIKDMVIAAGNAMMSIGRNETLNEQIAVAAAKVAADKKFNFAGSGRSSGTGVGDALAILSKDQADLDRLTKKREFADATIAATAADNKSTEATIKSRVENDAWLSSHDKKYKLKKDLLAIDERFLQLNKYAQDHPEEERDPTLKGVKFGVDKNGNTTMSGGLYADEVADAHRMHDPKGRKPRTNEYGIDAKLKEQDGLYKQEQQDLAQNLKDIKNLYDIGEEDTRTYLKDVLMAKETSLGKQIAIAEKEYEIAKDKKNVSVQVEKLNLIKKLAADQVNVSTQYEEALKKLDADQLNSANAYTAKLKRSYDLRQEEIDNALETAGMGDKQKAQYANLLKIQKAYVKEVDDLDNLHKNKNGPGGLEDAEYEVRLASAKAFYAKDIKQQTDADAATDAVQADWYRGASTALHNYQDQSANVASQSQTAFTNAFTGMENSLVSFATTGKANFKGLVTSILTDLARMEAKAATSQLLGLLINMGKAYFMSGSGTASAGATAETGGSTSSPSMMAAKGAAFDGIGGVNKFADGGSFTNGVVNSPTNFNIGQMGEAGPEAIVPLTRTSDGSLGVKQLGGGGSGNPVTVNTVVNVSGGSATANTTTGSDASNLHKQFADAMSGVAQAEIAKQMRQGGLLWKMKNGQTGGNG